MLYPKCACVLAIGALLTFNQAVRAGGFMGLGDLSGGAFESYAYGISDDGMTIVGQGTGANGPEAFRWTLAEGMAPLGDLAGGEFFSSAYDVSADGGVIVGHGTTPNGSEAFRWTTATGLVGLGDLVSPAKNSYATGISSNGKIIVGGATPLVGIEQAFKWTEETGMVGLPDLAGGNEESFAYRISGDGSTIVGEANSPSGRAAVKWNAAGSVSVVGFNTTVSSRATGVTFDGSRIVGSMRGSGTLNAQIVPFRSSVGGSSPASLGVLNRFLSPSEAAAISDDGMIVVGYSMVAVGSPQVIYSEAFVWDPVNRIRSLKSVLEGDFGLDLTGWQLSGAESISPDGTLIVGWGTNPQGDIEAWVATIPEPLMPGLLILFPTMIRRPRRKLP